MTKQPNNATDALTIEAISPNADGPFSTIFAILGANGRYYIRSEPFTKNDNTLQYYYNELIVALLNNPSSSPTSLAYNYCLGIYLP